MEGSHVNGATERQNNQTDEAILNNDDEVFKGGTDSSTTLKTTIVLKSTRDESSSTDNRSGSEKDQGTEKKYKCVIKARTSVEEYNHSSEGGDEVKNEIKPLKVVVRSRSTDDTFEVEDDNQTTFNNDKEISETIAEQAKEIVQELVEKLENEATADLEKSTVACQVAISDYEVFDEKSEERISMDLDEYEQDESEEVENKVDVGTEVDVEPALPAAEEQSKVTDETQQELDKTEYSASEAKDVKKEEEIVKAQPSNADEKVENVQPVIVQDAQQQKEQPETETAVETQEKIKQEEQQHTIPANDKAETEQEQQKDQDINVVTSVPVVCNEAEPSPANKEKEREAKAEVVAMPFEINQEKRDEEAIADEEQIPEAVGNESQPVTEDTKDKVLTVASTVTDISQEDKIVESTPEVEEIRDEQTHLEIATKESDNNEGQTEKELVSDHPEIVETNQDKEEKDETIATKFESEKEEQDIKNLIIAQGASNVEAEVKGEMIDLKFEFEREVQGEENLVTSEDPATIDVLPVRTIVEEEAKKDGESKAEIIKMKFESEKEEQNEENLVPSEELESIEVLPVAANEEKEAKKGEGKKAETVEMEFETKEQQVDKEIIVSNDKQNVVESEELPVAENVEKETQDEENKAENAVMNFATEEEKADTENFVTTKVQDLAEKHEETEQRKVDSLDSLTVYGIENKADLIAMKFESNEEQGLNEEVATVEDVSHKQPETKETETEPEVESTAEVDGKTDVIFDATKQHNELSQAESERSFQREEEEKKEGHVLKTAASGEVYVEMRLSNQEVSSIDFEGEEEPSSPKQEYVAELFNPNTQSLQEIKGGDEGEADEQLEEKPIVKVRLAEEPFNTVSDESQYDVDVTEIKEAKFDDDENEVSLEFFKIGENSDSDGEVDFTVEKHSQENEVLIKDAESEDEGMADYWMAKDDAGEVVFKGKTPVTAVTEKTEEAKGLDTEQQVTEHIEPLHEGIEEKQQATQDIEISESAPEIKKNEQVQLNVDQELDEKKETQLDEKEPIPVIGVIASENVLQDKDQHPETVNVEENVSKVKETQVSPEKTETRDLEISSQIDEFPRQAKQEIHEPAKDEIQDATSDDVIIASTKAITVCSDIGDLFPPIEEDVQHEKPPQEEEQVPEYDVDKEVTEEVHRIISKYNVASNVGFVAVAEEILPNEQKKKELNDFSVLMIDGNEEGVVMSASSHVEDYEEKPPSPVEAKKVTEEGITEIFETEELRRSGIFDDTLKEEDEETALQSPGISQKDAVIANEGYLEAAEKEKRGSLRWSLLEKWEEMNKRLSLEETDEITQEINAVQKEAKEEVDKEILTNELQSKDSLIVLEAKQPVCAGLEDQSSKEITTEDKELIDSEQPVIDVGIPVYAEPVQENKVAIPDDEPKEETEKNVDKEEKEKKTDKEALVPVFTTKFEEDDNQPQIIQYEFKETSEPVILQTVTTETSPSSLTTVKTTKTKTKTRVIKVRSEVQPATVQDDDAKEQPQSNNIKAIEVGTYQESSQCTSIEPDPTQPSAIILTEKPKQHPVEEQPDYIVEQPSQTEEATPIAKEDKQVSKPEEAPMSTILFRMDGTPVIIQSDPQTKPKQPELSKKTTKEEKLQEQPEKTTQRENEQELPKQHPETTHETQQQMSTILFRIDGTPFVVPPPIDRSTPKTVNFNDETSIRPLSINSVESMRGESEGVPPLAGEEESDIDDSSLHLAKQAHLGPSRAPTVSPVKEMTPPPSPQVRDDDDEEKKGDVESPLLDSSQSAEKGQKCCTIL